MNRLGLTRRQTVGAVALGAGFTPLVGVAAGVAMNRHNKSVAAAHRQGMAQGRASARRSAGSRSAAAQKAARKRRRVHGKFA